MPIKKKQTPPAFLDPTVEPQKESKLNVTKVSKTFSRKLNMSMHGGKQFETLDISETREVTLNGENQNEVAKELFNLLQASVESDIKQIDSLAGQSEVKEEKKVTQKTQVEIDKTELEGIRDLIQKLIVAKTKEDMLALQEEIKERQDLSKDQLEYLKLKYNSKAKNIQDDSKKAPAK